MTKNAQKVKHLTEKSEKRHQPAKEYNDYNATHRRLLESKKRKQKEEEPEEVRKDKVGMKFWKLINKHKTRREGIDECIIPEDWLNHFAKQL